MRGFTVLQNLPVFSRTIIYIIVFFYCLFFLFITVVDRFDVSTFAFSSCIIASSTSKLTAKNSSKIKLNLCCPFQGPRPTKRSSSLVANF